MRSLIAFGLATATATAALAGGGAHGGSMGGGFHGGGGMGGGTRWGGTPTIPLNAPGNHAGTGNGYGGGGIGGGGGGHWGSGGGHGGWHPGPGKPGGWHHPGRPGHWGGHYRRPFRGWRVPGFFLGGGFFLNDWWDFGLSSPPSGYNWVRYYDDALLVDGGGSVSDARYGLNWGDEGAGDGDVAEGGPPGEGPPPPMMMPGGPHGAFAAGYGQGYDDGFHDGEDSVTWGGHWRGGGAIMRNGNGTTYPGGPAFAGTRVFTGPGGGSVVVIQGPPTVTTTTTTTEEIVYAAPRRVWRAKAKRVWHKPACRCRCYCR